MTRKAFEKKPRLEAEFEITGGIHGFQTIRPETIPETRCRTGWSCCRSSAVRQRSVSRLRSTIQRRSYPRGALAFRHNVGGKRGATAPGSYDVLHSASGFCGNHHTGLTALHANSFLPPARHRSPATSPHDPWHGRSSFEFQPGGSEAAAVRKPDLFRGMPWKRLFHAP